MKFLRYLSSPFTDVYGRQSSHGDSVSALDGIRGLAVLIVLTSHTAAFGMRGHGGIGVFLFFALSGFVLMLPFADRPERIFQPREVWNYFANRALRIVPAFVVAVLLIAWQTSQPWNWVWLNLSFHSGWNHLWSVAEEVRFYFLFPLVVAGLALLPSRSYRIAALFVLILLAWKFRGLHRVDAMNGVSLAFYFFFFLTGTAACLIYRALERGGAQLGYSIDVLIPLAVAAVLNGWAYPILSGDTTEYPEIWCCIFLLLLVGTAISEAPSRPA